MLDLLGMPSRGTSMPVGQLPNQTTQPTLVSRRHVLAGGSVIPFLGLVSTRSSAQLPAAVATDAHVHLFNAADLPVRGFAQYVFAPESLGSNPLAEAVIDLLGTFSQGNAPSVAEESAALGTAAADGIDAVSFGRMAAAYIGQRARGPAFAPNDASVRKSYRQLEDALMRDSPSGNALAPREGTIPAKLARIA